MHWMTNIISWFICIFVAVTSIAVTGILWGTYYDIRHPSDKDMTLSVLAEFLRNETAVYVLAIIATIIMVILNTPSQKYNYLKKNRNKKYFVGLRTCNYLLPA